GTEVVTEPCEPVLIHAGGRPAESQRGEHARSMVPATAPHRCCSSSARVPRRMVWIQAVRSTTGAAQRIDGFWSSPRHFGPPSWGDRGQAGGHRGGPAIGARRRFMFHQKLTIDTRGRGTHEITRQVQQAVERSGVDEGLCHVFIHHTSASLIVCENADPTVRRDLESYAARLAPDGDPSYVHDSEGPDDMSAHIRSI